MSKTKKKMKLHIKIFIALGLGIVLGLIFNRVVETGTPEVAGTAAANIMKYIVPFMQFLGDMFIRLIRMIVVPLVFFTIMDAALSLGDLKKLRSIGIKTVIWFLATGMISATIGLGIVNIIQPGKGFNMVQDVAEMEMKELPGLYQTIIDLFPLNPFAALAAGEMMQIIVFALFVGVALLGLGKRAESVARAINVISEAMFKIVGYVIAIIPFGVFGLMTVTMTNYGAAVFGPVAKFILTDYLACLTMTIVMYTVFLAFIGKVSPIMFWKKAFEPWLIAFSTCTSSAALPVSMEVAPNRMGVSKEVSGFVIPLGTTAQMNGTCAFFPCIILFAAQLYNIDISLSQQILLCIQATFLSVGCAATPQIGLVISLTLLTQMGLPLEAYALVAGIYRIIDQIHTATNASGDLVAAVCIASMEGELDREVFNDPNAGMTAKATV